MKRTVRDWWNDQTHVDSYLKMTSDYAAGGFLMNLYHLLPDGKSLLELGMGPGKDLEILAKRYRVTGSDVSELFLNLYREKHPDADLVLLDAVSPVFDDGNRRFDAVFSNKVLVHLNPDELRQSLIRQAELLSQGGILYHSFWKGEGEESFDGLYFHYWTPDTLKAVIPPGTEFLALEEYREEEDGDSLLLILRKAKAV